MRRWRALLVIFFALLFSVSSWAGEWESIGSESAGGGSPSRRETGFSAIGEDSAPARFDRRDMDSSAAITRSGSNVGDTDSALAEMARRYENAVGVVVVVLPDDNNKFRPVPLGTAWAVGRNAFATNSHITNPVSRFLKSGLDVFIVINKHPDFKFRVLKALSHPRYKETARDFNGKASVPFTYDVGILKINGATPNQFGIAGEKELRKLGPGYRVAYLGFPMEGLLNGNINVNSPVATMQSGIITSVSDYWHGEGGFEKNLLLRHNLGAVGGASGSPLFNVNGEVVGILNAGNVSVSVQLSTDKKLVVARTPSAAMVNFGQRIDLLMELLR